MIILETSAGLCNRMRAVMSAINLASEYNTNVQVIWPLNKGLNCRFDEIFEPIFVWGEKVEFKYTAVYFGYLAKKLQK